MSGSSCTALSRVLISWNFWGSVCYVDICKSIITIDKLSRKHLSSITYIPPLVSSFCTCCNIKLLSFSISLVQEVVTNLANSASDSLGTLEASLYHICENNRISPRLLLGHKVQNFQPLIQVEIEDRGWFIVTWENWEIDKISAKKYKKTTFYIQLFCPLWDQFKYTPY